MQFWDGGFLVRQDHAKAEVFICQAARNGHESACVMSDCNWLAGARMRTETTKAAKRANKRLQLMDSHRVSLHLSRSVAAQFQASASLPRVLALPTPFL